MLLCLLISHKVRRGEDAKAPLRGDFATQNVHDYEAPASTFYVIKNVQNIIIPLSELRGEFGSAGAKQNHENVLKTRQTMDPRMRSGKKRF